MVNHKEHYPTIWTKGFDTIWTFNGESEKLPLYVTWPCVCFGSWLINWWRNSKNKILLTFSLWDLYWRPTKSPQTDRKQLKSLNVNDCSKTYLGQMFCFCLTHVSVGIFMSRSQPSITHSTPSTQHILLEIMLFLGHLFIAGSCRCCWQLLSWKEVPATPKSKCFCFHFPVLVGFFFFYSDVKVEEVFLWEW